MLFSIQVEASPLSSPALTGELERQWMVMNYYHPSGRAFKSEIVNSDFFVADDGRTSPTHEYAAFTEAMRANAADGSRIQTVCAFPARMTLVAKYDPEFKTFKRPDCSKMPEYTDAAKVTDISLIFASGYFESPASYFGHTMLKFSSGTADFKEYFFDSSLNYGAKVTDSTANPLYIVNGLTGGYTASYQRNNDFINTHSYTNKQMRDVWEYPLKLTAEQRLFLVEYSTEMKRARFKYYFLNDNCAHRMARIIEMATDREMVGNDVGWLLPIQVVQELERPAEGETILEKEVRHPSLKTVLRQKYLALGADERVSVKGYLLADKETQSGLVTGLGDGALAVVLDQYDVEISKLTTKPKDAEALVLLQEARRVVLVERLRRPAAASVGEIKVATPVEGETPATLRPAGNLQVGYVARDGEDGVTLRYQAANNDLLTKPIAGQEASRFIMGAAEVEMSDGELDVKKVTLVDIASLNTNPISLGALKEFSWSVKAEYGARNSLCNKCSTINLDGKVGKAVRLTDDVLVYGLIGGQLNHHETDYNDVVMLTSENGVLVNLGADTRLNAGVDIDVSPIHGNPAYLYKGTLVHDLTRRTDVRLGVENDGRDSAVMVKFGVYFN